MKSIPALLTTTLLLLNRLLTLEQNDKQVWMQRFGAAAPSAVAVDSSGNIIVTGGGLDYADQILAFPAPLCRKREGVVSTSRPLFPLFQERFSGICRLLIEGR